MIVGGIFTEGIRFVSWSDWPGSELVLLHVPLGAGSLQVAQLLVEVLKFGHVLVLLGSNHVLVQFFLDGLWIPQRGWWQREEGM